MRVKKKSRRRTRRIVQFSVFFTAVALLAVLLTSLDSKDMSVDAASLKHIDEIVASSGTFNILEIVPDTAGASVGYYVDGQEPIAGWKDELAALTSPAERSDYVNTLFGRLANRGALSGGDTTPLRQTYYDTQNSSYYTETYEPAVLEDWNTLELAVAESTTKTGTFTEADEGPFEANYTYSPLTDGGYVQNISYFSYTDTPDTDSGAYYYQPGFEGITPDMNLSKMLDTVVYSLNDVTGIYFTTVDDNGQPRTVQDIIDSGGFDISSQYFYVNPAQTSAPGDYHYEAVLDTDNGTPEYIDAPVGAPSYFTREIDSFTYVGAGGHYVYSSEGSEEWTIYYKDIYYKAGFANNNLLKELVFDLGNGDPDRTLDTLNVTVTVRTAAEVDKNDVSAAKLIYLSTGSDITQGGVNTVYDASAGDIGDEAAAAIYNFAVEEYPVIIDYDIIDGITQYTAESDISGIQKLCLLALQSDLEKTEETSLTALSYDWDLLLYIFNDIDRTFVSNNIYCFNAFNTDSTNNPPNIPALVTDLFDTPFLSQVYDDGFSDVLSEIQYENFLRERAGDIEPLPEIVSVSTSIRHIINYKGHREAGEKNSIRILDLEPAKVSVGLTEDQVKTWIENDEDKTPEIEIIHMTTGEFIGKLENLNESYDMIYIGMSTESLNTHNGETVYNDGNMNKLIYSNIGDTYRSSIELAGIREQDYVWANGVKAIDGSSKSTANLFRFSGNDITEAKAKEITQFAQAGYPIILADGFISDSGIDKEHVDICSYMYQAVSAVYSSYNNVMTENFAGVNDATVIQYLNMSKPEIVFTVKTDENSKQTLNKPEDYEDNPYTDLTSRTLEYEFKISNITDATPVSTTYDCRLYVDLNADGRYADSEELGIEVYRALDGRPVASGQNGYALAAEIEYRVTHVMAKDYVGIIPWKLEIIKNGADQIHASAEGFTRIAAGAHKETINVLQIMADGTSGSQLNLGQDNIYKKFFDEQNEHGDFNIHVTVEEAYELEAYGTSEEIFRHLNDNYNMLIIGFHDMYDGIKGNTATAIKKYIEETGKSVLFTHDTTSLSQVPYGNDIDFDNWHYYDYPMATEGGSANPIELSGTDVLYNQTTSEYASINGNIHWYGSDPTDFRPLRDGSGDTYVVFLSQAPDDSWDEDDYYEHKAVNGNQYQIYKINNITGDYSSVESARVKNVNDADTVVYVYCAPRDVSGWYSSWYGYISSYKISMTCDAVKFVNGNQYVCTDISFDYRNSNYSWGGHTLNSTNYDWLAFCLANDSHPANYEVAGTYDGTYYYYNGSKYWPPTGASFPSQTLFDSDPSSVSYSLTTIPNKISDWGYYFNTVIRDAVGLDRYGVTSTMNVRDTTMLKDIVNTDKGDSMSPEDVNVVQNTCNRSVAFMPKSESGATVDEYQGYTNYALIRFPASGNSYKYTNNNYSSRTTSNVAQVNKGQITTYPYNVNTKDFSASGSFIGSGGSYMTIGETHEQYFQINMNTDDIVVWYCLSSGGYDNNSYYDDVPNDCVNAYYIYNKGNVTYSGVGHTSAKRWYDGTHEEYVNEAKLFVNTMIAAYRAGKDQPSVKITDAEGKELSSSERNKSMAVDEANSIVLQAKLDDLDEERAVYYKVTDPNKGETESIAVSYYVADETGDEQVGGEPVTSFNATTYYPAGTDEATTITGGNVYKFYLPDECLIEFAAEDVYELTVYVRIKVTYKNNSKYFYDSLELKKQQLFELS